MSSQEEKDRLLEFCTTQKQRDSVEAIFEHGSGEAAARVLGRDAGHVRRDFRAVKHKATMQGWSPDHDMTNSVPAPYVVRGHSTLYDEHGQKKLQWVKTKLDPAKQEELVKEIIENLTDSIPREAPVEPPSSTLSDLASCYVLSDYHIGQLSWRKETGDDWDTKIAEDMLVKWFGSAISSAPDSAVGVFAQLGDLLHYDSIEAVTPTSGNVLEADTRFPKIVEVCIRSIRRIIAMMLLKHHHVHIIMAEGNHDIASSVWLRQLLAEFYADEPRVTVDTNADPYYCFEWGNTSLFYHHGHKAKMADLSRIFAGKYREVFGRTRYSYAHVGHLHHVASKEDSLMIVEQHPTLAAKSSFDSRMGHSTNRGASVITYSKKHGEVGRVTLRPEMVK